MNRLYHFLQAVEGRIDSAIAQSEFHSTQKDLLEKTVTRYRRMERLNPLGAPVALFYLIVTASGRKLDEQVERMAAFCSFFLLAADLMDDVQDDDLQGKPHEEIGAPIATNNGVTLLFLALIEFHKVAELERDATIRSAFFEMFHRLSLKIVTGQHLDLLGHKGPITLEEVLRMNQAKTSSLALIAECAALLSGSDKEAVASYRKIGEQISLLVQVRDDLQDIFGKEMSPDLKTAKMTYPVACYLESASPEEVHHFNHLVSKLPDSMADLRVIFYSSGTVKKCAEAMEECRLKIHDCIASVKLVTPEHRMLLDMADGIAETIYIPPPLDATVPYWKPKGEFHELVREEFAKFVDRMKEFGLPTHPTLRPWHWPQWMYDSNKKVIFYPDVQDQAEEILPFQMGLLGTKSIEETGTIMRQQVPLVMAHEMFHFWRDASGRLTDDHWHEEWVANRLVVTYLRDYVPEALERGTMYADLVMQRFPEAIDEKAESILERCVRSTPGTAGYGMDITGVALVEIEIFRRLAAEEERFKEAVMDLLV